MHAYTYIQTWNHWFLLLLAKGCVSRGGPCARSRGERFGCRGGAGRAAMPWVRVPARGLAVGQPGWDAQGSAAPTRPGPVPTGRPAAASPGTSAGKHRASVTFQD